MAEPMRGREPIEDCQGEIELEVQLVGVPGIRLPTFGGAELVDDVEMPLDPPAGPFFAEEDEIQLALELQLIVVNERFEDGLQREPEVRQLGRHPDRENHLERKLSLEPGDVAARDAFHSRWSEQVLDSEGRLKIELRGAEHHAAVPRREPPSPAGAAQPSTRSAS